MTKNSKRKLLIMLFLTIMLVSSAYASLTPKAHAVESTAPEKTLVVLNDVVGLNVTAYTPTSDTNLDNAFYGLPQEEVDFSFKSNQGKLRARCTFVNKNLHQIYISDIKGSLSLNQPTANVVDMAKGFLERYQNYAGESFYGELRSMLDTVNAAENITKTNGNVQLEVSVFNSEKVNFIWRFTDENGVPAVAKNVVLSYDEGWLQCFLNNWPLYTVAGTPRLSSEEATAIALKASKNFSYEVNTDNGTLLVSNFKVVSVGKTTLSYLNHREESSARGGDPFTLYPSWYVPLGFDKFYPGGVTGMTLRIWADTGEVSSTGPMVFDGDSHPNESTVSEALNQEPTMFSSVPIVIVGVISVAVVSLSRRRKGFLKFTGVTLLCFLISFSMITVAVPKVNASIPDPDGTAVICASMDLQISEEQDAAEWVCDYIEDCFDAEGYDPTNLCGSGTTKTNVLNHIQSSEREHHRAAMFHFGHLYEWYTAYRDNDGYPIYWYNIDDRTVLQKHFFVWLWVCSQAQYSTDHMPVAWTHRDNSPGSPYMSNDGYDDPDDGLHCFICFNGSSPVIGNWTGSFKTGPDYPAKYFIAYFYAYALDYGYSVNDALNEASLQFFWEPYISCPLYEGYETWFPGNGHPADWYEGRMLVFGNGDIHLNPQYDFTVTAKDQYNNQFANKDVYIDLPYNIANTGATIKVTEGDHTFFVNDFWESGYTGYRYYFDYWQPEPGWQIYYQPLEWDFDEDWTITAYFDKVYCPGDADGDGDADLDDYDYFLSSYPSTRGDYTYKYLSTCDFNSDGDVDNGDKTYLEGILGLVYHQLTVLAYNQYNQQGYVPLYIDSQYVGTTGYSYSVQEGNHQIYVASPLYEYYQGHYYIHVFQYYYYDSTYNYNNPMTLSITADKTVTAYYYTYLYM